MSPPSKHPIPQEISIGSTVRFYKNEVLMSESTNLLQIFYCFGVSLYNYSQIEVLGEGTDVTYMGEDVNSYFGSLKERIPYKDLDVKNIFKI